MSAPRAGGPRERGSIMLQAMIALLLLSIFFALAVEELMRSFHRTRLEVDRRHLTALVDASIATTLAEIRDSGSVHDLREQELAGGAIASEVEEISETQIRIHGRASYRGRETGREVTAHRNRAGYFVTDEPRYWSGPAPGEGF